MTKTIIKIFISLLILPLTLQAQNLEQAESAYSGGDYQEAINIYRQISEKEGVSAPLLFNLGNAYLMEGDYGNAMLCYQRGKKLDPSNSEINNNISYLTGKIEDANKAEQNGKRKNVEEDTPNFFQAIHTSIAKNRSSNSWAIAGAVTFILFIVCVVLYLFTTNVIIRKTGFFGGILLLGISVICVLCSFMAAAELDNKEYGIIMGYKVALLTEPDTNNTGEKNEGVLTPGTKVRIISEETDASGKVSWYKVRLNSDYIGWLKAEDLAVI